MTEKAKMKPAAKFLIIIAVLVSAFIVSAIAISIWFNNDPAGAVRFAYTPGHSFESDTPERARDYTDDSSWAALPNNQSNATAKPADTLDIAQVPEVDVFFVHPTTYLSSQHWNAPANDEGANDRLENRVLKIQASAFNLAGRVFAPRYRQATFGAFFDNSGDGLKAIGLAYSDVLAAFDNFIEERSHDRPFILAGHSQGSLHLLYLLQHRINGTELSNRMVAAYIIGWPVSLEADIEALSDITACNRKYETGCVVSFQTFGLGGNPAGILEYMNTTPGLSGAPRKDTQMLCTNPQDWIIGSNETRSAHLGAVILPKDVSAPLGKPIRHFSGTQCGTDGILYLTDLPGDDWKEHKLYGENYHVYDYHMFYMNIRENAALRAQTWLKNNMINTAEGR